MNEVFIVATLNTQLVAITEDLNVYKKTMNVIYVLSTENPVCALQSVGYLNYDVWRQMPGFVVDDMRIRRSFPNHPDVSGGGGGGSVEGLGKSNFSGETSVHGLGKSNLSGETSIQGLGKSNFSGETSVQGLGKSNFSGETSVHGLGKSNLSGGDLFKVWGRVTYLGRPLFMVWGRVTCLGETYSWSGEE